MFDFATLATTALGELKAQFETMAPVMFATALFVTGAFVGLRMLRGGIKVAFSGR